MKVFKTPQKSREATQRWRLAHPEHIKKYKEEWYSKNKDQINTRRRAWENAHQDEAAAYRKKWRKENPEKVAERQLDWKEYSRFLRIIVLAEYGNKCVQCGYDTNDKALQIDHVNGGGILDRKKYGNSTYFYLHIIHHNFPSDYQILCANCNIIKR